MRRKLTTLPLLFLLSLAANAQTSSTDLMKSLYSKFSQITTAGSSDPNGSSFLVLATPGFLIDPSLNLSPLSTDYHLLATVLDRVPDSSWVYKPKNRQAFDVYANVLKYHQTPIFKLTKDQADTLKNAQKILYADVKSGTPSEEYKQFRDKRTALVSAAHAVDMYQAANPRAVVPPDLVSALQNAYDDYNLFGKANEVLAAEATVQQLEDLNPNEWWGELQNKLQLNQKLFNATPFGPLDFYPDYSVWFDKTKSWTNINLTESSLQQSSTSSHTSIGGGLSASWGFWSVGGSYGHEETRTSAQLTGTGISLQLELTQIAVQRPWMDDLVFHSTAWQWGSGAPDCSLISDGGSADNGITPRGQMPFLISGLLLARNVSLSGNWNSDLKTSYDSMTSGGASVGWGPFSFGGSYVSTEHSDYHSAQVSGSTISYADPQIIGFFVQTLPMSPHPSPTLKFDGSPCQPAQPAGLVALSGMKNYLTGLNDNLVSHSLLILKSAKEAQK